MKKLIFSKKFYFFVILTLFCILPELSFTEVKPKKSNKKEDINIEIETKKLSDKKRDVRIEAIKTLSNLKSDEVEQVLLKHFSDEKDPYVKIQIMEGLLVYQTTTTKQVLIDGLYSDDPIIRQSAAFYLGDLNLTEQDLSLICKMLEQEQKENVKLAMINSIEKHIHKSPVIIPTLFKMLDKQQPKEIRKYSATILKYIPSAKKELEKYKTDPDIAEVLK